jgi:hypothetical protein
MARPPDQQLAEIEARLARLKSKNRSLETGQKIIAGALILNGARNHAVIRKWMIASIEKDVTRPIDKQRMLPILNELKALESPAPPSNKTAAATGKTKP